MKGLISLICIFLAAAAPLKAASDTFIDYQNYNHGYCPDCNCYPCRCAENVDAPVPPPPPPPPPGAAAAVPPPPASPCGPKPDACTPATICATNCGISLWIVGLVIAGVATAGALIVSSNNGAHP